MDNTTRDNEIKELASDFIDSVKDSVYHQALLLACARCLTLQDEITRLISIKEIYTPVHPNELAYLEKVKEASEVVVNASKDSTINHSAWLDTLKNLEEALNAN